MKKNTKKEIPVLDENDLPIEHYEINAGIGTIQYTSSNLQLLDLMERLDAKLKTTPPNNILV